MASLGVCCEGSDSFAYSGMEENGMICVYRNTVKEEKPELKRDSLRIDVWVVDNLTYVGLKNNWVMILNHTGITLTKNKCK